MPDRTWYFASRTFQPGELSRCYEELVHKFAPNPDRISLAIDYTQPDGWSVDKDQAALDDLASFSDLNTQDVGIRIWFEQTSQGLYLSMRGIGDAISVNIAAQTVERATELLASLVSRLNLKEVREPLYSFVRTQSAAADSADMRLVIHSVIADLELADILASRWAESLVTQQGGSHLSTIILLGSVLEGVLYHVLTSREAEAMNSSLAPKTHGKPISIDRWTLEQLISVAHERGWIDRDVRDFSTVLRSYRNLVHPREQLRSKYEPDSGTCKIAREVVAAAIDDLAR